MATKTGISSNTNQRMVLGPGAVYLGAGLALLGATKGGNTLEINRVFKDIRPDGAKGKVKGFRLLESSEAILTVKLMEITEATVKYLLSGSSLTSHVITGGEIAAATYISQVSLAAEITGSTPTSEATAVNIVLTNCLVEGPFNLALPGDVSGEAVVEVKFHAHFDPAALTTEPWAITFVPAA